MLFHARPPQVLRVLSRISFDHASMCEICSSRRSAIPVDKHTADPYCKPPKSRGRGRAQGRADRPLTILQGGFVQFCGILCTMPRAISHVSHVGAAKHPATRSSSYVDPLQCDLLHEGIERRDGQIPVPADHLYGVASMPALCNRRTGRLAIARVLKLRSIPAMIGVVHRNALPGFWASLPPGGPTEEGSR
jgi:hypothetical protein